MPNMLHAETEEEYMLDYDDFTNTMTEVCNNYVYLSWTSPLANYDNSQNKLNTHYFFYLLISTYGLKTLK